MSKKVALVVDNSGSLTREEMEKINVQRMIPISLCLQYLVRYRNILTDIKFIDDYKIMIKGSKSYLEMVK